jgi:hypothetical protein
VFFLGERKLNSLGTVTLHRDLLLQSTEATLSEISSYEASGAYMAEHFYHVLDLIS